MKKNKIVIYSIIGIAIIAVIIIISLLISSAKKKTKTVNVPNSSNNPTKELVLSEKEKPYVSLSPQTDGHRLDLKITNIPSSISEVEYDLIYTAEDEGLEIEKGVGGTAKIEGTSIERELLLGTESCTNGCKYKYDEGITGGTLTLNFITSDNQVAYYEAPFLFTSSSQIKEKNGLSLNTEGVEIKASVSSKEDYFILIKNFANFYSVFSNGKGSGKVLSITPDTVTKEDMSTVVGDYLIK